MARQDRIDARAAWGGKLLGQISTGPGGAALAKLWKAELYDPAAWSELFRKAGARYAVMTSKHHDGFCLWDSKDTDYDIMSTPFRRDVLKELTDE